MPWYRKFQGLMPYRVREALLVSSSYDAFVLEEDGPLAERLFSGYTELNLHWAPRITHATTAASALEHLASRRFDLVITVPRVRDTDAAAFSKLVKTRYPYLPLVLLILDEGDLHEFPDGTPVPTIDRVFLWTGDAQILLAAIKLIEDEINAAEDTRNAGVQVIIVVEDRVRSYSTFLALLYPELLSQAQSLLTEDYNDLRRLVRMRARPKILLANTFDEGLELYRRYHEYVYALISDVTYPRAGEEELEAGLELARLVREQDPDLPILLQSAGSDVREQAASIDAHFIDKNSTTFQEEVQDFLREVLGFGDFVFRLPNRTEVGRARNTHEMERALQIVPAESLEFHAARHHFTLWLKARSMFELVDQLQASHMEDFATTEDLRAFLVTLLAEARSQEQAGVITDFSPKYTGPENRFVRIGRGSIGGKGRGLAFINSLVATEDLLERFPGLQIRIPKTIVVGTNEFDRFMEPIELDELLSLPSDAAITTRLLAGQLRPELRRLLRQAYDGLRGPLAVRSSSLLEDSRFQPFAGVYATYMLPNNDPNPEVRFAELCRAIKAVYASAYLREARTYMNGSPHDLDDQKMAIVIQQLVGQQFCDRYYPHFSGVAQSYNFYPIRPQKAADGLVNLALGLGHMVVSGGACLSFSPATPHMRPQFPTARSYLSGSQSQFYALDLKRSKVDLLAGPEASLDLCNLDVAERDGTLDLAASVYSSNDDRIRDDLKVAGPRILTFNNILKWKAIPLAAALSELLALLRDGIGSEVEIEFAVDMADWGRDPPDGRPRRNPRLYLLQVRPQASPDLHRLHIDIDAFAPEDVLCRCARALGNGVYDDIRDIVYVTRDDVDHKVTKAALAPLRAINDDIIARGGTYLLIGPGRWGTSAPTHGIPIEWSGISGARVIVETAMPDRFVMPSQGSHFFQNLVAQRVGYLTVTAETSGFIDRAWLDAQPAAREQSSVRHIRLDEPLGVCLDGVKGAAVVLKSARTLLASTDGQPTGSGE